MTPSAPRLAPPSNTDISVLGGGVSRSVSPAPGPGLVGRVQVFPALEGAGESLNAFGATSLPGPARGRRLSRASFREMEKEFREGQLLAQLVALAGDAPRKARKGRPAPGATGDPELDRRRESRNACQRLRAAARALHPWDTARNNQSRIFQCGRVSTYGEKTDPWFGKQSGGDVNLYGTQSCCRAWECAVCRSRMSRLHAAEIGTTLDAWHSLGRHATFFTLTTRHRKGDDLRTIRTQAGEAWEGFTSGRQWHAWRKAHRAEYVLCTDITYSEVNGWHVHYHGILFTPDPVDPTELREWLYHRWCRMVGHHMGRRFVGNWQHAVDVETIENRGEVGSKVPGYIAKMGFELVNDLSKGEKGPHAGATVWQILDEADRAHTAGQYALKQGDTERGAGLLQYAKERAGEWNDYVTGMYRARWVRWSKAIRDEMGLGAEVDENDPEAIAAALEAIEAPSPPEVVRIIPHEIRRTILYHPFLVATIRDALERGIDPDVLIAPYLSAWEFAVWEAGNSPERLREFAMMQREKRQAKRIEDARKQAQNHAESDPPKSPPD